MIKHFLHTTVALSSLCLSSGCQSTTSYPYPAEAGAACTAQTQAQLNFPTPLSAALPCDVPPANAQTGDQLVDIQRLFEIYGWQQFIAMNWPFQDGHALSQLSDNGYPRWQKWKEAFDVYLPQGATPSDWADGRQIPSGLCNNIPAGYNRVLYRTSKTGAPNVADEINQAFTYPMWDQNGNIVRYEVAMNLPEFDFVRDNTLYNIEGQIDYNKQHKQGVVFPSGSNATQQPGAIEIKLAWKILTADDIASRYLVDKALIVDPNSGDCDPATVGLVGMHISQKTVNSPQWIWSTFEHVDNLDVNPLASNVKKPSFFDPNCATCAHNVLPEVGLDGKKRNQVARVIPIPKTTVALNTEVQTLLKQQNSVLQYYNLVGTQWPVFAQCLPANPGAAEQVVSVQAYQSMAEFKNCRMPQPFKMTPLLAAKYHYTGPMQGEFVVINSDEWKIANKSGGQPNPVYLTNMTMETYFQKGNQTAQFQIQGFPFDDSPVFGTESCIGCHYSAGSAVDYVVGPDGKSKVAVYGGSLTADFSWLLQLKAQWKNPTVQ